MGLALLLAAAAGRGFKAELLPLPAGLVRRPLGGLEVAVEESVITCPSPLNVLKDTYFRESTIIAVIEHVQINIST